MALESFEDIMEPLPGENPAGTDLRLDPSPVSPFRQVKDAREEARRLERAADLEGEESAEAVRQWRTVHSSGLEILREQSRDLEVAAYIIEALVRIDGFAGLAEGIRISRLLIENFWGDLFPEPDEDGIETTLLPLSRMNGDVLVDAINRIPVTQGSTHGPYRIWQHRQALELSRFSMEEQEERVNRGAVNTDMFERAIAETDPTFFRDMKGHIEECIEELDQLGQALDERAGADAPIFTRIQEGLEDAMSTLRLVAGHRLEEPIEASEIEEGGESPAGAAAGGGTSAGVVRDRESAFQALLKVADFFERSEPQSLLPSEIKKIVRRGRMTPEELYIDLISDDSVLEQMFRDVGIERTKSDDDY